MNNGFIEGLPSSGIKVIVAECQDPATFWVKNWNLLADPNRKKKCDELEYELANCQQLKLPSFETHLMEVGELVAVKHPETNIWCRGKVCDIFQKQSKYLYKVFLVDKGYPVVCIRSNLRNLPHAFKCEPFETYSIRLYGIIPQNFEPSCSTTSFSLYWNHEAFNLVTKLIAKGKVHYFVPLLTKHVLCGELYVELDNEFVNVGDELCKAGLAFKNPTLFKSSLNLLEMEEIQTEFNFSESVGNNAQCELSDKNRVEQMNKRFSHEMDVTKFNGLGRAKIKMYLGNSRYEGKPGLERNLVESNTDLKASNACKNPLIGIKNDFSNIKTSCKISMGRGEHLKQLQHLRKEYSQESNTSKNKASSLKNKPEIKPDDHGNLISQFETKLSCNERKCSTASFVPAGAESSVLQRIILKRKS